MPVLSTTSRETDEHGFVRSEKYVTEKGYELTVRPTPGGLWEIIPASGGVPPVICQSLYTSHLKARDALIAYVKETDRLGYAEYPDKPKDAIKKRVAPLVKAD